MRGRRPIYVESRIRAPLDVVWKATQDPELHQRWDVRFGRITYLDRQPGEPQRFTYSTSIVPGVTITGTGESLGDKERADGSWWSGLRFWANDRRSIIRHGGGYWRYIPTDDGVRFLTRYDYVPRWGLVGEMVDRWLFRPAFGWATAWSFDRLRMWLEDGIPPEHSRDRALIGVAATAGLAGVWLYQGLVPKLLKADATEVELWEGLGLTSRLAKRMVRAVGVGEIVLGLAACRHDSRLPLVVSLAAMPGALAGVGKVDASRLTKAFNPVSLNWAVAALTAIAWVARRGLPSGGRPLRRAPDAQPPATW